jgi:2-oxoacid:acceptor oxidoreductase delta subunit (pyruvate/2-ketoisovalerate family)
MKQELPLVTRVHTSGRNRENVTGDQRTMVPVYDFDDKSSPCRESCPAGHDISWALHLIQSGEFTAAHRLFLEESPFPSVTGRVCYHPCETWCNRKDYDDPIAINALERTMSDYGELDLERPGIVYPDQPVAVVGSGPAGTTVAYHLAQLGYPVVVFEKDAELGGALRYGIPRYRLPSEVLDAAYDRLGSLGVEIRCGVAVGEDVSWDELESKYAAVFLGVGKPRGRDLLTPGIDVVPAQRGVDFLRDVNSGVLDALDGPVAVIGGGDVAIDCVRSAVRLGAGRVHLFCLESRDQMPAHPEEVGEAVSEGLFLNPSSAATQITVGDDGRIRITFRNVTRFDPALPPELGDIEAEVTVDRIVFAIGQEADAAWVPDDLWRNGTLDIDEVGNTAVPKVFAGGDAAGSYNVVEAIGAGKRASIGIDSYLRGWDAASLIHHVSIGGKGAVSMRQYREARGTANGAGAVVRDIVKIDGINLDYFPKRSRIRRPELGVRERGEFREVNGAFSREQAIAEAKRCFNCSECTVCGNCFIYCPDSAVIQKDDDFFMIDPDHCKGCGVCVKECPRSAMAMVVERGL